MCSIVGSFDSKQLATLLQLNTSRGTFSSSYTTFDSNGTVVESKKTKGPLLNIPNHDGYVLCHQQAPTSGTSIENIHPSNYKDSLMWHNGILKQYFMTKVGVSGEWDTLYLNKVMHEEGISGLKNIEGSFACVYHFDKKLFLFRNMIAPMFFKGADISSTNFEGSREIEPNTLYELDFVNRIWSKQQTFENIEQPFYFYECA